MLFKDVLVDPKLKQQIVSQVHEHRMGHALFFLEQSGSHAFALAVALGQYLCCENPGEEDACGVCPSCQQYEKLAHPDLHIYFPTCISKSVKKDPDSQLFAQAFREFVFEKKYFIDIHDWLGLLEGENKQASINIRDCSHIINQNSMRAYAGGYKVYILWNVDRLYHAAAPKLLKTLEEPEKRSLFILLSQKPDAILSTILSRTQLVKIPRLTQEEIVGQLQMDFPDLSIDDAENTAILAEGDYIKALKIHEDNSELKIQLRIFSTMMDGVIAFATQRPAAEVHYAQVQEDLALVTAQGRETQKQFLQFILRMLRNCLMLNTQHDAVVKATSAEYEVLQQYRGLLNLKQISRMCEECNKAFYHVSRNGNSNLIFTDLFFKLAASLK